MQKFIFRICIFGELTSDSTAKPNQCTLLTFGKKHKHGNLKSKMVSKQNILYFLGIYSLNATVSYTNCCTIKNLTFTPTLQVKVGALPTLT